MRKGTMFQLVMSEDLEERVKDFRFANRLNSQSEALRQLIERGLAAPAPKPSRKKATADAA